MDREQGTAFFVVMLLIFGIGCLSALAIGIRRGERIKEQEMRMQAVEMGIGEWRIIDNSGKIEFHWKELTSYQKEKNNE